MTPTPRCGTPPPGNGKDAGDDAKPKEKHRSAYDGKLYVEAYLKQQNQLADDAPQAIAQSVISGFETVNAARVQDTHQIKGMLANLVHKIDELDAKLSAASATGLNVAAKASAKSAHET